MSNGVVELRDVAQDGDHDAELAITPVLPSDPLAISGEVASLWRSLVDGGVGDKQLSDAQRALVREFAEAGIASTDEADPRRIARLGPPWFESFMHELVCALAIRVAQACEARCLVIKGPTLHAQELRERVHSGDVDLLIDPAQLDEFLATMAEWGWRLRPNPMSGTVLPHSHTLLPGAWGCEIDVHYRIPGIAASPEQAFEILWREAEERVFAGVRGFAPVAEAHALIQALTLARPMPGRRRRPIPHEDAVEALRRGTDATLGLAVELRAHGALQHELRTAFAAERVPLEPAPDDWIWLSQPNPARVYLSMLKATPWRRRPAVLRKILLDAGQGTATWRGLLRRWLRGARQLSASKRARSS